MLQFPNLYYSINSQKINNNRVLTAKDWSQGRAGKPVMKEQELNFLYDADGQNNCYD